MLKESFTNSNYVFRLLSIWYENSNNECYELVFNTFIDDISKSIFGEIENKELKEIIDNRKSNNYMKVNEIINKVIKRLQNDSFEIFEHIIY